MRLSSWATALVFCLFTPLTFAKDLNVVYQWPAKTPMLKITLQRLRELSSNGDEKRYELDLVAENISGQKIVAATPHFTLMSVDNARVGQGNMQVSNLGPNDVIRFQLQATATGTATSMQLLPPVPADLDSARHDYIELRDGTVLNGDVISIDAIQAVLRIGSELQTIPRDSIRRVLMTEREHVNR